MSPLVRTAVLLSGLLLVRVLPADVTRCACDPSDPESLKRFECSLCAEAEKQPPDIPFFFLKDNNPIKPNRWLILPRKHYPVSHAIDELSDAEWSAFWQAAIDKGRQLWGDGWGLAYNGERHRRQCHGHVHIGKLLKGVERDNFIVVSKPSQIPRPGPVGMWIHPAGKRLHVHLGEGITETVLVR